MQQSRVYRRAACIAALAWLLLTAATWVAGPAALARSLRAELDAKRDAMLADERRRDPAEWQRHVALTWRPQIVFLRTVPLAPAVFFARYDARDDAPLPEGGMWGVFLWTGRSSVHYLFGRTVWMLGW